LKLERVQVICPACGQQVEAVARDGRVKGYCAVAKQYVDFLIETQRVRTGKHATAETRAKISAALTRRHNTRRKDAGGSKGLKKCQVDTFFRPKMLKELAFYSVTATVIALRKYGT